MSDVNSMPGGEEKETPVAAEESAGETTPAENGEPKETAGTAPGSEDELQAARDKAEENWSLYVRAMAEADNLRKRAARDLEHAHKYGLERFAAALLEVKDSMEMGLEAAETAGVAALKEGMETTLRLFTKTLAKFNIEEIDPEGEPFDPEFHEAMAMQESDAVEPNTVLTVVQKGYSLNGRLLRAARVFVAKAPSENKG